MFLADARIMDNGYNFHSQLSFSNTAHLDSMNENMTSIESHRKSLKFTFSRALALSWEKYIKYLYVYYVMSLVSHMKRGAILLPMNR